MTKKYYNDMELSVTVVCGFCSDKFTHNWATDGMGYGNDQRFNVVGDIDNLIEEQSWAWREASDLGELVPSCPGCLRGEDD